MKKTLIKNPTLGGGFWTPRFIKSMNAEKCTRCGFCIKICPGGVFSENTERDIVISKPGDCRGCYTCERLCKDKAIVCGFREEIK